jgi:hypothetical protein
MWSTSDTVQIRANVTLPILELSATTMLRRARHRKARSVWASISSWVVQPSCGVRPSTPMNAALQGRHVVPSTLLNAAGVLAIAVPALLALAFNRYIVNGLLAGSNK